MHHYFAYGSNMDLEQMKQRCPDAVLIGPAFIEDFALQFNIFSPKRNCGCADIVPSTGSVVWGLLFEMTEGDMEAMDQFEGVPRHYKKIHVTVKRENGERLDCTSYEVADKESGHAPSKEYLGKLTDAAETFRFPEEYARHLSSIRTKD